MMWLVITPIPGGGCRSGETNVPFPGKEGIAKNHVAEYWREHDALEFQDGSRKKLKPGKSTNIGNDLFLNQKQNQ